MESYTYWHSGAYGSDEIDKAPCRITSAEVSADGMSARLKVEGLRELHVHELHLDGVRSRKGTPLLYPVGYYTLNRIP